MMFFHDEFFFYMVLRNRLYGRHVHAQAHNRVSPTLDLSPHRFKTETEKETKIPMCIFHVFVTFTCKQVQFLYNYIVPVIWCFE